MTTIYYTSCKQLPQAEYRKAVSSLPMEMQNRLFRYRRWQDAHAYLYGRLLLKEGMLQFGYTTSFELMKETQYGKPYFTDNSFTFNISHSEGYIVCVISNDEKKHIGIDIEKIKPIALDHFSNVLSLKEKKNITSDEHFYKYWTRKEAVVKADGRGLNIPLNTIDATKVPVKLGCEHYYLNNIDIDEQYLIHVASLTKIEKMTPVNCLLLTNIIEDSKL